jgi:hypothetical protein
MTEEHVPRWEAADFDTAVVERDPESGSHVLTVAGVAPSGGERSLGARLLPVPASATDEYARITVELDKEDAIFLSEMPYRVSIPLDGIRGSKGVEVVGRDRLVKIDVP